MMSGRGAVAVGMYRSVGSVRCGEYAALPGVAVGRDASTKLSCWTVNANGRPAVTEAVDEVDLGLDASGELDPSEDDEHAAAQTRRAKTPTSQRIPVKRAAA